MVSMYPIRVRKGYGIFFLSTHCQKRMNERGIHFREMKDTIRDGFIVYERVGVSKVVGDDMEIIFETDTRHIYTVYRPYKEVINV
jgi:hypothetical protein